MFTLEIIAFVVALIYCGLPSKNEIKSVPLYSGSIPFKQYSGYVSVSEDRYLFYWYVESMGDPEKDPLLLWMSGGPGCSSMEGLSQENGPFIINEDATEVKFNPYSWNNLASVIYLESPAGVGYSFSNNPEDYKTCNDNRTASDVYNFLQTFLTELFPERASNDFYVSAESYGGHYCPVVSWTIHENNLAKKGIPINLKGYLVGNGASDRSNDANSLPRFLASHMLISDSAYQSGIQACHGDFYKYQSDPKCAEYLTQYMQSIEGINMYGIYHSCEGGATKEEESQYFFEHKGFDELVHIRNKRFGMNLHPFFARHELLLHQSMDYGTEIPCMDTANLNKYFNMKPVQDALGVDPSKIVKGTWDICNFEINQYYDWTFESMIPFHKNLIAAGYYGLLYSGDTDMAVNGLGTRMTAVDIVPGVDDTFEEWYVTYKTTGRQVAGFTTGKKGGNFRFATVRGAGHMVPQDKSQAAYEMVKSFFLNQTLV